MTATEFRLEVPLDYVETTIPAGMTIAQYRASRPRRGKRFSLAALRRGRGRTQSA